jgi:hypothetical protein
MDTSEQDILAERRADMELDRSTLAEWVGGSSRLFAPLVEAMRVT